MKKRVRNIEIKFYVTPEEEHLIEQNMALLGTNNRSAFIRKMALDGIVVKLDLPEVRELTSLLRRSSNNLNQVAKRANTTGSFYEDDINDMKENQERIWELTREIVARLSEIR